MIGKHGQYLFVLASILIVGAKDRSGRAWAQTPHLTAPAGASRATKLPLIPEQRPPEYDVWAPPDIDAAVPSVASLPAFSVGDVVAGAGRRIQELVSNLSRFTATESVQDQSVSRSGKLSKPQTRKFNYLVSIGGETQHYLNVQELRGAAAKSADFPEHIATEGTPMLVLIFDPLYAQDFDMKCEGLSHWNGQPAWQVRFEQKPDRKNRLSIVAVGQKAYNVRVRGRAWILADSYQVARLDTDLAGSIPEVKLRLQHINVEYRPVAYPARGTELWLPSRADLFMDFAGRRFYRRHLFANFTLFSVDVQQQFAGSTAPQ